MGEGAECVQAIPNRILFVWTGERFPYFCRLAVESVLLADPAAEVWLCCFGDRPDGSADFRRAASYRRVEVVDLDVPGLFEGLERPREDYLRLLAAIPASAASARSNLVRYGVLHRYGGVYLDFDILLLRDLRHLLGHEAFVGEELVWQADEARVEGRIELSMLRPTIVYGFNALLVRAEPLLGGRGRLAPVTDRLLPLWSAPNLNNAVIGARPGNRYLRRVLAAALTTDPRVRYGLGPSLVSRVYRESADGVTRLPREVFYCEPPSYSFRFFACPPYPLPGAAVLVHYVSSNHGRLLARLDRATLLARRDRALFYRLGADVADRAEGLPRR
jgi:hypothetical protein